MLTRSMVIVGCPSFIAVDADAGGDAAPRFGIQQLGSRCSKSV